MLLPSIQVCLPKGSASYQSMISIQITQKNPKSCETFEEHNFFLLRDYESFRMRNSDYYIS